MKFLLIKKTFWDGWDNFLPMCAWNLIITACIIAGWFAISAVVPESGENILKVLPSMLVMVAVVSVLFIPVFAAAFCTNKIADWKAVHFTDFFKAFPAVTKDALVFGLFIGLFILFMSTAMPFYFRMYRDGKLTGIFFCALIFWVGFISILAFQWYIPLKLRMQGSFFKTLKKCYIIYFDNANFSFFMFLYVIFQLVFSAVMLIFTIHGISGITLSLNVALKLRLYKYDYLEEHPELDPVKARKQIPWDELVAEDEEILGPRNIKSFFYPWR